METVAITPTSLTLRIINVAASSWAVVSQEFFIPLFQFQRYAMKKLILLLKFIKTGLTIRNLFILILGGISILLFMFIIQFFIGGLDNIEWFNDMIFPIIMGALIFVSIFEKLIITWEEYSKKNK